MSQYYKKYMKKREEEKPSYAKLFVGAFFVVIVFSAIFMTHSLLGVDTSIGENDEVDIKESGIGVKHLIDSRLRFIKMEDESAVVQTKEKSANIEEYSNTVKEEIKSGYSGNYQSSYGYDSTQETKPYSQTYTNTQKQVTSQPVSHPATTANTAKTYTVPAPVARPKPVSSAAPAPTPVKTYSSGHNIQKNLTPTGMN